MDIEKDMYDVEIKAVLFPLRRQWHLSAKGNYPAKDMVEIFFFDLDQQTLVNVSVELETLNSFEIKPDDEAKIEKGKTIPVSKLYFKRERKGRATIEELVGFEPTGEKLKIG